MDPGAVGPHCVFHTEAKCNVWHLVTFLHGPLAFSTGTLLVWMRPHKTTGSNDLGNGADLTPLCISVQFWEITKLESSFLQTSCEKASAATPSYASAAPCSLSSVPGWLFSQQAHTNTRIGNFKETVILNCLLGFNGSPNRIYTKSNSVVHI